MIIGIVCVNNNWCIGKNNDLLYHLKCDMEFFKKKTQGHICVMGYNCFKSLPTLLKDRLEVVLCPKEQELPAGVIKYSDFNKLVEDIKVWSSEQNQDVYIIGGGMLYKSFMPYYDLIYVTKVNDNKQGDVYFPDLSKTKFRMIESLPVKTKNYEVEFRTYVK